MDTGVGALPRVGEAPVNVHLPQDHAPIWLKLVLIVAVGLFILRAARLLGEWLGSRRGKR